VITGGGEHDGQHQISISGVFELREHSVKRLEVRLLGLQGGRLGAPPFALLSSSTAFKAAMPRPK
jgi:hypothetical protein